MSTSEEENVRKVLDGEFILMYTSRFRSFILSFFGSSYLVN